MRGERSVHQRLGYFRRWLHKWLAKLVQPAPADDLPRPDSPYPDYVTCPYCGELEVEVWSNQKTGRCHNCGQTFDYPLTPRDPTP